VDPKARDQPDWFAYQTRISLRGQPPPTATRVLRVIVLAAFVLVGAATLWLFVLLLAGDSTGVVGSLVTLHARLI
jgi:hypothetical protein